MILVGRGLSSTLEEGKWACKTTLFFIERRVHGIILTSIFKKKMLKMIVMIMKI